jgi:hypothetical protein
MVDETHTHDASAHIVDVSDFLNPTLRAILKHCQPNDKGMLDDGQIKISPADFYRLQMAFPENGQNKFDFAGFLEDKLGVKLTDDMLLEVEKGNQKIALWLQLGQQDPVSYQVILRYPSLFNLSNLTEQTVTQLSQATTDSQTNSVLQGLLAKGKSIPPEVTTELKQGKTLAQILNASIDNHVIRRVILNTAITPDGVANYQAVLQQVGGVSDEAIEVLNKGASAEGFYDALVSLIPAEQLNNQDVLSGGTVYDAIIAEETRLAKVASLKAQEETLNKASLELASVEPSTFTPKKGLSKYLSEQIKLLGKPESSGGALQNLRWLMNAITMGEKSVLSARIAVGDWDATELERQRTTLAENLSEDELTDFNTSFDKVIGEVAYINRILPGLDKHIDNANGKLGKHADKIRKAIVGMAEGLSSEDLATYKSDILAVLNRLDGLNEASSKLQAQVLALRNRLEEGAYHNLPPRAEAPAEAGAYHNIPAFDKGDVDTILGSAGVSIGAAPDIVSSHTAGAAEMQTAAAGVSLEGGVQNKDRSPYGIAPQAQQSKPPVGRGLTAPANTEVGLEALEGAVDVGTDSEGYSLVSSLSPEKTEEALAKARAEESDYGAMPDPTVPAAPQGSLYGAPADESAPAVPPAGGRNLTGAPPNSLVGTVGLVEGNDYGFADAETEKAEKAAAERAERSSYGAVESVREAAGLAEGRAKIESEYGPPPGDRPRAETTPVGAVTPPPVLRDRAKTFAGFGLPERANLRPYEDANILFDVGPDGFNVYDKPEDPTTTTRAVLDTVAFQVTQAIAMGGDAKIPVSGNDAKLVQLTAAVFDKLGCRDRLEFQEIGSVKQDAITPAALKSMDAVLEAAGLTKVVDGYQAAIAEAIKQAPKPAAPAA